MKHAFELSFQELSVDEVLDLRTRVLRPHFVPGRHAHYLEDRLPMTVHFGVVDVDGRVLGVATFFEHVCPIFPHQPALKLRGMAVDENCQGLGIGRRLLDGALPRLALRFSECSILWCNARTSAVTFYEHMGFEVVGEEFEIKGAGPHFIMWRRMPLLLANEVLQPQDLHPT